MLVDRAFLLYSVQSLRENKLNFCFANMYKIGIVGRLPKCYNYIVDSIAYKMETNHNARRKI